MCAGESARPARNGWLIAGRRPVETAGDQGVTSDMVLLVHQLIDEQLGLAHCQSAACDDHARGAMLADLARSLGGR